MDDLRKKDPTRKVIDRTSVVLEDIIDAIVEYSGHLARFEETAQSRFGMVANQSMDKMIERCELLKRRVNDIRHDINNSDRNKRREN